MLRTFPFAALLLAGCATTPAEPMHEGPVAIGQTAYVGGPQVKPLSVVEDTRCLPKRLCAHGGRVILRALVTTGPGSREMTLVSGQPVQVADGALVLERVTPDRGVTRMDASAYRFLFRFDGGY